MSEAATNLQQETHPGRIEGLSTGTVFALLAVATFLLRIFYAQNLYQDDGLWFTSAQELLRGKLLYREIYFDKPPVLPFVYAAMFKVAGAHILTVRVFTMLYSLLISTLLYKLGKWLYSRREGLLAAAMFAVFSTTFTTGHVQGLNTDFLMVLPYTTGAFCFLQAVGTLFGKSTDLRTRLRYALSAGLCVAVGAQTNPKALFDLLFFAVTIVITRLWLNPPGESRFSSSSIDRGPRRFRLDLGIFAATVVGAIIGTAPFLVFIAQSNALRDYWFDVWDWGARYAHYYSLSSTLNSALAQTFQYFGLNPLLLFGVAFAVTKIWHSRRTVNLPQSEAYTLRADLVLLIWFAVSYAGLATGGRFFGHYFFQLLPSLCVLASRGFTGIISLTSHTRPTLRRAVLIGLCAGILLPIVRFHGRTLSLALDWVRRVQPSADWLHARLNLEEKQAAEAVTGDGLDDEASDPHDTTRSNGAGPQTYLFVWGYRPEIYFWSQLRPASRFLSSQPLTGVPADVHYFGDDYRPLLKPDETARRRAQLAADLAQTRPKYIVDELEFFNSSLSMRNYPDLQPVIACYKRVGIVGRFVLYIRRDLTRRYLRRHPCEQSQ